MARYYDEEVGRFLIRDIFHGFEDEPLGLNNYIYTKNNPVMFMDVDGHYAFIIPLLGIILRFATPLVRKYAVRYGALAAPKIVSRVQKYASKIIGKYKDRYKIISCPSSLVVIIDQKIKKRIFAIDYGYIDLINPKEKIDKRRVWHYHKRDEKVHYVFRWDIPRGYKLPQRNAKERQKYRYV